MYKRQVLSVTNIPLGAAAIAKGASPVNVLIKVLSCIIETILSKLIVFAIDKSEESEIRKDCIDIINSLEQTKSKINDDNEKKLIDNKIEEINKLMDKLK